MPRIRCKTCRRLNEKLCGRAKCALIRKSYPPGVHGSKRRRPLTEYGEHLRQKQRLRVVYGLGERPFRSYVNRALVQRGDTRERLLWALERRFDNVVMRLGFAPTLAAARQLTTHGHFLINGKRINAPSYALKTGDTIRIRPSSIKRTPFQDINERNKKYAPPAWLRLDKENLEGTVLRQATPEDIETLPINIQAVLEYYSR